MSVKQELLSQKLREILAQDLQTLVVDRGEVTIEVKAADYARVAQTLRDHGDLYFEQMMDLSGVDYSSHCNAAGKGRRYAVVSQLLSLKHNWRLRLRTFAEDDDFPVVDSVVGIWSGANWYEREAFDMVGVLFSGHPDLRRILTDYGFIGHPLRKDFPVSGYAEMRYDPEKGRVIYQPVTIEPRENTPRIVREAQYGDVGHG